MVTLRTTTVLIFFFLAAFMQAQTVITGGSVSGTWEIEGSPYIVNGDLYVLPDDRFSIDAGVQVYFSGNYGIEVTGRLDVNGSENQQIIFTVEDTLGFASGQTGWKGITFSGFSGSAQEFSSISHCVVEYSLNNGITCDDFPLVEINHCTLRYNKKAGLGLYTFSDVHVEGIEISNNGQCGLEIDFSSPQIMDFLIEYNNGPGIQINGNLSGAPAISLMDGDIRHNMTNGSGGGLNVSYDSHVELKNVNIYENSAVHGGGIYSTYSMLSMENVSIYLNESQFGGGLFSHSGCWVELQNCLIAGNSATEDGGALWMTGSDFLIHRTSISNNSAGNLGGGFYNQQLNGQSGTVTNSIIWGNFPDEMIFDDGSPVINYSNVAGGYPGLGNMDADPLFEDAAILNYRLSWSDFPLPNATKSPCIDAGDPDAEYDADGTIADIGAFYFHQETVTGIRNNPDESFRMYPNPSAGLVNLVAAQGMNKVSIHSLSGHVVWEETMNGPAGSFDISRINPGIYIVRIIQHNGEAMTGKLIRE